ncbi:hypothetical protein GCM10018966_027680 [Streptomyces yanii]
MPRNCLEHAARSGRRRFCAGAARERGRPDSARPEGVFDPAVPTSPTLYGSGRRRPLECDRWNATGPRVPGAGRRAPASHRTIPLVVELPGARECHPIDRVFGRREHGSDVSVRHLYMAADRAGGAGSSPAGAAITAPRVHT